MPRGITHTQRRKNVPSVRMLLNLQNFFTESSYNLESEKEFLKMCSTGQGKKSLAKVSQMLNLAGSLWHKTDRTAAKCRVYNSAEKLWALPGPQKTTRGL